MIELTSNAPTGGLSGIKFYTTTAYDRNWLGWYDAAARLRVMAGYHSIDYTNSLNHYRYEIKTSDDPAGATPANMATRFWINTDSALVDSGFHYINKLYISHGKYDQGVNFGLKFRGLSSDGTTDVDLAELYVAHDASDNTQLNISPITGFGSSKQALIRLFRSTDTSGTKELQIFKGDNTATATFKIDAHTGAITTMTFIAMDGEAGRNITVGRISTGAGSQVSLVAGGSGIGSY